MYSTELQTVNGGNVAVGSEVTFDLPIGYRWCKIVYIKIVQRVIGAMKINFEIWETSTYNPSDRADIIRRKLSRNIDITADQGSEYGEILHLPLPYEDKDTPDEESTWRLHCRIVNHSGGTASDFDVLMDIADIAEVV